MVCGVGIWQKPRWDTVSRKPQARRAAQNEDDEEYKCGGLRGV
jgi:hypothetical protein